MMISTSRKSEILQAEERFRRQRYFADRLAESGIYIFGPLQEREADVGQINGDFAQSHSGWVDLLRTGDIPRAPEDQPDPYDAPATS